MDRGPRRAPPRAFCARNRARALETRLRPRVGPRGERRRAPRPSPGTRPNTESRTATVGGDAIVIDVSNGVRSLLDPRNARGFQRRRPGHFAPKIFAPPQLTGTHAATETASTFTQRGGVSRFQRGDVMALTGRVCRRLLNRVFAVGHPRVMSWRSLGASVIVCSAGFLPSDDATAVEIWPLESPLAETVRFVPVESLDPRSAALGLVVMLPGSHRDLATGQRVDLQIARAAGDGAKPLESGLQQRPDISKLIETAAGERPLSTGLWGGEHIRLTVTEIAADVEYDCAFGKINGPLLLDEEGNFEARGTHVIELGGPRGRDVVAPTPQPAQFHGWTDGSQMRLTVTLPDSGRQLGPFSLGLGRRPELDKCG